MPKHRLEQKPIPKKLGKSAFPKLRKNMDYHKRKNQFKLQRDTFSRNVLGA